MQKRLSHLKHLTKVAVIVCIVLSLSMAKVYGTKLHELNERDKEIASLNTEVNNLTEQLKTSKEALKEIEATNETLNVNISEYKNSVDKLTKDIKKMEDLYDKNLSEYKVYEESRKVSLIADGFLSHPSIDELKNMDLTKPSLATVSEINQYLEGTGLEGLGYYYKYEEAVEGMNAIALMSISILESKWGKSNIAVDKNNILSWTAYDKNPYENATYFNSKSECITTCTPTIKKNYLSNNGIYYNGKTLDGMNVEYSSASDWSYQVAKLMQQFDIETRNK